ncbi:MFS transporter [Paenibacillus sp. alder61]|uniref:MFS transporter n=1 Tax=Paenibacillus faecis TaxID=862114 RepID=A0A5D0CTY9_9BACL|nr:MULTISPECIES: MFS transporter [Paenibacillus]MCA1293607.1 MFS transporter [Paenibacillus sp. alder61]TYA12724.1 MFS transporter [Paenibacillus faecis]
MNNDFNPALQTEPAESLGHTSSSLNVSNRLESSRPFLVILCSVLLLSFGSKLYEIILPLMMYDITHSSVAMSSMKTAELLPNFFFALFIGVLVDRVDKKRWVLWMIGLQALLLIGFVLFFRSGTHVLPLYYTIGFLLMTFNYGYFNAQTSLTKLTVPTHRLTSANAKLSFAETLVGIMGPALSAMILLLPDISDGLLITAGCYGLCMLLFTRLRLEEKHADGGTRPSLAKAFTEGWTAFKSNTPLWMMTVFVIFLNCSSTVVNTTVIFFAKDELKLSSSGLAVVLSAAGVGGLAASLFMGKMRLRLGLGKLYAASILISGAGYLLLFLTDGLPVFLIALFLTGLGSTVHSVCVYSFRQEQTPAPLMGRIAGITGTLFRVGMPIAVYASGWIIAWYGSAVVFLGCAVWNLVVLLVLLRTRLRGLQ